MSKDQRRIFLWAVPRSTSTAFLRAMGNRHNIKVLFEPFARAYFFGPDKVSSRFLSEPITDEDTFENMRDCCEQPYLDVDEVFAKDMAYYIVNQPGFQNLLPHGYIHTFLIRHPMKSVLSGYKAGTNKKLTGFDYYDPHTAGFKDVYQILDMVTRKLGQTVVVVDADDLLAHPEYILRRYCNLVGIEFQQSMVEWKDGMQDLTMLNDWSPGWFEHALTSKGFDSSTTKPVDPLVIKSLPQDIQQVIEESMPYYNEMYALRIKPEM